jgi:SSS family solute:Na+ symporter
MYDVVKQTMGGAGFSPLTNPEYGWAYVIFQVLVWLAVHTCWQTTAMRTFSTKSPEVSKKVFSWAGFIFLGRGMMPMMWGIAALAMLGPNQSSLEAMPRMLATVLPSGILGLVVAGMLAATMSVNSSYLLGWSSILAQDIILPLRRRPMSSRQQVMLNRAANLFVSIFVMVWGLWYTLPGPTYFYLNMTASIYLSGTLVTVIAGLYWKRATVLGGYLAMAGGAIATIAFFFFKAPASYAGLGTFLLAGVGMLMGSFWSRNEPTAVAVSTRSTSG